MHDGWMGSESHQYPGPFPGGLACMHGSGATARWQWQRTRVETRVYGVFGALWRCMADGNAHSI